MTRKKPEPALPVPAGPIQDVGSRPAFTEADIEHALAALREVGTLARAATGISRDAALAGEGFDALRTRVSVLQLLVDRVGSVAEMGLRRLGDKPVFSRV
ncbi:hypothetical protein GT347_05810 [Xylophilus rhododendri]|uniref:Uncharacterized protein n=1 Tax=Xylophilus rhododendri TaxID=2697032 RepID=A0A857J1R8_9BURK|nr:hypothetical protein [Xylophilus rhododendri]QHI97547.1 hypothetical protein GT347_05810 [Xylophilus rhododendri]